MSEGVIEAIGRNADIDTRRAMTRAGFHVPIQRVKIPDIHLPTWTHVMYPMLKHKQYEIMWMGPFGFSSVRNKRTGDVYRMDTHSSMMVIHNRNGRLISREYHPDYFVPCVCGCGYNTDRSHKRIRPRAVPPSFSKAK